MKKALVLLTLLLTTLTGMAQVNPKAPRYQLPQAQSTDYVVFWDPVTKEFRQAPRSELGVVGPGTTVPAVNPLTVSAAGTDRLSIGWPSAAGLTAILEATTDTLLATWPYRLEPGSNNYFLNGLGAGTRYWVRVRYKNAQNIVGPWTQGTALTQGTCGLLSAPLSSFAQADTIERRLNVGQAGLAPGTPFHVVYQGGIYPGGLINRQVTAGWQTFIVRATTNSGACFRKDSLYFPEAVIQNPMPEAPTNLTALAQASGGYALAFTDNAVNETKFDIEYSVDPPTGTTGGEAQRVWRPLSTRSPRTGTGSVTFTALPALLPAGVTMYFRAQAANAAGASTWTYSPASKDLRPCGIDFTVTADPASCQITVAVSGVADELRPQIALGDNVFLNGRTLVRTVTTGTYSVTAQLRDNLDCRKTGNVSITCGTPPPPVVQLIKPSTPVFQSPTPSSLTIAFTSNNPAGTVYHAYIYQGSQSNYLKQVELITTATGAQLMPVTGLQANTTYYTHINAIRPSNQPDLPGYHSGLVPASPTVSGTTSSTTATALAAPASLTHVNTRVPAAGQTTWDLTFSWPYPTGVTTLQGFRVAVYRGVSLIYQGTATASQRSLLLTGIEGALDPGIAYTARVSALSTAGSQNNSAESIADNFTLINLPDDGPPPPPDGNAPTAPTNLSASNYTSTGATLTWAASTDNVAVTGYEVYRGTEKIAETSATAYVITGLGVAQVFEFRVRAKDGDGNFSPNSNAAIVSVCQPATAQVSDIAWISSTNGWGPAERNKSNGENNANDGTTLCVGGVSATKGIGVHSQGNVTSGTPISAIVVDLGGAYTQFTAQVGVQCGRTANLVFEVWADNVRLYQSATLTASSAPASINVNLTGAQILRLVTLAGPNGGGGHGAWLNTTLNRVCTTEDKQVPEAPKALSAVNVTPSSARIRWTTPKENFRVASYEIYEGNTQVGTTVNTYYDLTGLTASTPYLHQIVAKDAAGNASARSEQLTVTTSNPDGSPEQAGYPDYSGPDFSWVYSVDPDGQVKRKLGFKSDDGNDNNDWWNSIPDFGAITHRYMKTVITNDYRVTEQYYNDHYFGLWFFWDYGPQPSGQPRLLFEPRVGMDFMLPLSWTNKPSGITGIELQRRMGYFKTDSTWRKVTDLSTGANNHTFEAYQTKNQAQFEATYRLLFRTTSGDVYSSEAQARWAGHFSDPTTASNPANKRIAAWKKGWMIDAEPHIYRFPLTNIDFSNYAGRDVDIRIVYTKDTLSGRAGLGFDNIRSTHVQRVHFKAMPSRRVQPATPASGSGLVKVEKLYVPAFFRTSPYHNSYVGDTLFPRFQPLSNKYNIFDGILKKVPGYPMLYRGWTAAGGRAAGGQPPVGRVARFSGDGWLDSQGPAIFGDAWNTPEYQSEPFRHGQVLKFATKEQLYEAWKYANAHSFNYLLDNMETIGANLQTGENQDLILPKLRWVLEKYNREMLPPTSRYGFWAVSSWGNVQHHYYLDDASKKAEFNSYYNMTADQIPKVSLGNSFGRDLDPNTPGIQSVSQYVPLAYPQYYPLAIDVRLASPIALNNEINRRVNPAQKNLSSIWELLDNISSSPGGKIVTPEIHTLLPDGTVINTFKGHDAQNPYPRRGGYTDSGLSPSASMTASLWSNVTGDGISPWDCNCEMEVRELGPTHTGGFRDHVWLGIYQLAGQDARVRQVVEGAQYGQLMEVSRDNVNWVLSLPATAGADRLPMARFMDHNNKVVILAVDEQHIGGARHDIWVRPVGGAWKARLEMDGNQSHVFYVDSKTPVEGGGPVNAPAATSLSVGSVTQTTATVNWTQGGNQGTDFEGFFVKLRNSGGTVLSTQELGPGVRSASLAGLTAGTTYSVQLTTKSPAGRSFDTVFGSTPSFTTGTSATEIDGGNPLQSYIVNPSNTDVNNNNVRPVSGIVRTEDGMSLMNVQLVGGPTSTVVSDAAWGIFHYGPYFYTYLQGGGSQTGPGIDIQASSAVHNSSNPAAVNFTMTFLSKPGSTTFIKIQRRKANGTPEQETWADLATINGTSTQYTVQAHDATGAGAYFFRAVFVRDGGEDISREWFVLIAPNSIYDQRIFGSDSKPLGVKAWSVDNGALQFTPLTNANLSAYADGQDHTIQVWWTRGGAGTPRVAMVQQKIYLKAP